jgi:phenylglyoxylate dehydrogenase beta subunit
MIACAQAKSATEDVAHARIRIVMDEVSNSFAIALCRQCDEPGCVMVCPSGALAKDPVTGVVTWDNRRCVTCLLCTVGCAYAGIAYEPEVGHVAKCDLCDGMPACVAACAHDALFVELR